MQNPRRILALAAVAALVCTATAAAGGDNYKMRMGAAGNEAARAVLLTASDIGPGWTGGSAKPDLTNDTRCANFHPRVSDLVMNGAARATYKQPGFQIDSESFVLASAKMVSLDWRRSISSPNFVSCGRKLVSADAKANNAKLVSFRRIAVPRIGDFSIGFRIVIDAKTKSGTMRMVVDNLSFAKGRTEMALTTTMPIGSVAALAPNEVILAKLMAGRVRA
jgi:hypothetical protein